MIVSYCVFELKTNIRSIPATMAALRWCLEVKFVNCAAFDDDLLKMVKQGIARMHAPPHRIRLPCTLDMINYILNTSTAPGASLSQLMLATGIAMFTIQ
jgi:hypothetical protein